MTSDEWPLAGWARLVLDDTDDTDDTDNTDDTDDTDDTGWLGEA